MDEINELEAWNPPRDENGAPIELPPLERIDRTGWPEKFDLKPSYEETSSYFWAKSHELHKKWLNCYDKFIEACNPPRGLHTWRYIRTTHHSLFGKLFGFDFPFEPWLTKSQRTVQMRKLRSLSKQSSELQEEHGPECPAELRRMLAEAARSVDVQPSLYDSAVWASEHTTVVLNLGWESVDPDDCIGLTALGLLQEAVNNPQKFYKEVLLPCVSKSQKQETESFADDGSEQIGYVEDLKKYLEAGT